VTAEQKPSRREWSTDVIGTAHDDRHRLTNFEIVAL
jgi:hypothetical protein